MKFKDIIMLILAAGCGFLGGVASTRLQYGTEINAATINSYVVRTSKIELLDPSDKPRAILGTADKVFHRDVTLSFLTQDGKTVATFGVEGDSPSIQLMGTDGRTRASLALLGQERPVLGLGNGGQTGVALGAIREGDFIDTRKPENFAWQLQFLDSGRQKAAIGLNQNPADNSVSGMVAATGPKGTVRMP